MATSPEFGAGQAWPQPSQRLRPGWPHSVPGGADAASLRASQGFNQPQRVSGSSAPIAPAAPLDLRGGNGVNPAAPAVAAPEAAAAPAPKVGIGRAIADGARTVGSTLRTGAGVASAGFKASFPAGVGAGVGVVQQHIDKSAPETAPFVPPAATAAGIPIDPNGPRGPARVESHPLGFGPDNEFTRNLANTMNALPGVGPATNALRAGSTAARMLTAGENTAKIGAQVVRGAQSVPGYVPPERQPTPFAPTTPAPAALTDAQRGGALPAASAQSAAVTPGPGSVLRAGNSFSGENVKAGFGYTGQGRPPGLTIAQGGGGLRGGGTVTGMDTSEGFRQDQMEVARLRGERVEREAQPMGGVTGIYSPSGTESFGRSLSVLSSGNMKPRDIRHANGLANEREIAGMRERGETLRSAAGQNTARAINAANNATARRSNDQNNQTSLRGQDMELEGRMAPARLAAQQRALHGQVYNAVGAGSGEPGADHHLKAAATFDAMGLKEQAAEARAAATAMSGLRGSQDVQASARAADTEKLFRPMFTRETKDAQGNVKQEFDEVAAAKAAATVRGIYGEKFDGLSPAKKREAMTEIVARQKNQDAERQVMPGIGDAVLDLVGLYDKPAEVSTPRNLRGGKPERAGLFSRPGVDRNSTLVRLPNGQTVNYGVADAAQLEDIHSRLRP